LNYLLFDFDGTIADTYTIVEKVGMELARKHGLSIDPDETRTIGIKNALIKADFPLWKLPALISELKKQLAIHIQTDIKPFEEIVPVLAKLAQKYNLAIVSSNSKENIESFLNKHKLFSLFTFVYSDSSIFGKHAVLKRLLAKYQINPAKAIYVGDEDRDIQAARKLHLPIISVSWGYNSPSLLAKAEPDYLIDKPRQILDILCQIERQRTNLM
jgi:phosphoglycolate phosphatase